MSLVIFCLLFSSVDYVPVNSQGGSGEGTVGKGDYRNNHKGHRTKSRQRGEVGEGGGLGWGGVEGWGEKAYNCN